MRRLHVEEDPAREKNDTRQGDRLLARISLVVGALGGLLYIEQGQNPLGLIIVWSGALLLSLLGVNRHLSRFIEFWCISLSMLTIIYY